MEARVPRARDDVQEVQVSWEGRMPVMTLLRARPMYRDVQVSRARDNVQEVQVSWEGRTPVMTATGVTDVGRLYQLTQAGTLKAEYIYNDLGQRTKKILYQSDGTTIQSTTRYQYDPYSFMTSVAASVSLKQFCAY